MQEIGTFILNHPLLFGAMLFILILLMIVEWMRAKRQSFLIKPIQVTHLINHDNAVVIDVRMNEDFQQGHIIDAMWIPAQDIKNTPKKLEKYKINPIIIVCASGVESQKIATSLLHQGYNVYALAGGMRSWQNADLPLVKG